MEKTKPRGNPMRQACAWGCGCALLLALRGCQRDSAEPRLRKDIAIMQQALEKHRLRDAMAVLADDFAGEAGIVLRCTTCCARNSWSMAGSA
ncbi:hypothetical protein [Xanthomonas translucens]|nr:hypothetical protein [Xanthomonas translucens]MCT8269935.1 hypothetical protein [Xanthomonas translucens pv. undulosa]MCT8281043.1 hypothetical protein [Xanthomonas translucens pv. undulosa]MCT8315855.1 hypothetical protein [Xanthomonas translucens pv. undulosa]UJB16825.1 hypothetical protein LTC53_09535 [Xanthomonas translucens pv. undulosa]UPU47541.1 hypothetical protein MZO50_12270 [Xanthomonas translucens pv. undulosa]